MVQWQFAKEFTFSLVHEQVFKRLAVLLQFLSPSFQSAWWQCACIDAGIFFAQVVEFFSFVGFVIDYNRLFQFDFWHDYEKYDDVLILFT